MFHVCQLDGRHDKTLCPNGTIFNQKILACDWWYNTDCTSSSYYYIDNEIIFNSPVKYPPSHYYNSGEHDSRSYGRHGYDTSVQVRHYGSPPLIHFNQRLNSENYENVITSTTPNYNQFDYDKPTSKPPLTQDSREYDNSGEARFPESAYHGYWTLVSPRPENGYNESPNYNNQLSQSLVLHYDPVDSVTYSSFDTGLGYDSSEKTHSYQVKKRQSQNTVTRNKKSPENSKTTI